MATPTTKDRVNRLLEMVVEEVSLVDRAANKHRFLIVKRSDGMDETNTEGTGAETDLNAEGLEGADDAGNGADPGAGADPLAAVNGPLAAAVAALEGLTEAVELLAVAQPASEAPRLSEMAAELQEVAGRLADTISSPPPLPGPTPVGGDAAQPADPSAQTKAADPKAAGKGGSADSKAKTDAVAEALATFRAALDRLATSLSPKAAADSNPQAPGPAPAPAPAAPQTPASPQTPAAPAGPTLVEQLGALVGSVQALTGTVQQQQQRLSRLEKRSGLPNSQPAGEHTGGAGGSPGSWPMDLNRPVDRESVAKAVSFHDL